MDSLWPGQWPALAFHLKQSLPWWRKGSMKTSICPGVSLMKMGNVFIREQVLRMPRRSGRGQNWWRVYGVVVSLCIYLFMNLFIHSFEERSADRNNDWNLYSPVWSLSRLFFPSRPALLMATEMTDIFIPIHFPWKPSIEYLGNLLESKVSLGISLVVLVESPFLARHRESRESSAFVASSLEYSIACHNLLSFPQHIR